MAIVVNLAGGNYTMPTLGLGVYLAENCVDSTKHAFAVRLNSCSCFT